jgi:hypothetical protein
LNFEKEGKIIVPRFGLKFSSNFRLFENYFPKFISFQSFKEFEAGGQNSKMEDMSCLNDPSRNISRSGPQGGGRRLSLIGVQVTKSTHLVS